MRHVTDDECMQLEADRRTADAFRGRRAQMVLANARGLSPHPMAQLVGCSVPTVCDIIHAFEAQGVEGLARQLNRPKTVASALDVARCERLQHILPQSPRLYAKPAGVWTLALAAVVSSEQGSTERGLRDASIRRALKWLQTHWKRAQRWITSPAPHYGRKKSGALA